MTKKNWGYLSLAEENKRTKKTNQGSVCRWMTVDEHTRSFYCLCCITCFYFVEIELAIRLNINNG